ncbi:MAG: dihydrofolate reductase [Chloroflexi bacterium]|nr:MAG: dihydrofolate reductase [Chloroflexota bacterium]
MSSVTCQISISLDGFVAGPNQSLENPIGEGGMRLHQWLFETDSWHKLQGHAGGAHTVDSEVVDGLFQNVGAYIMGRHMFGGGRGGTTFNFVTDGIDSALEQARLAGGAKDIVVAGGAHTVQQFIAAGLLDELYLHIVPIVLGAGERLLENVGDPMLKPNDVIASPAVTHVRYRIGR